MSIYPYLITHFLHCVEAKKMERRPESTYRETLLIKIREKRENFWHCEPISFY